MKRREICSVLFVLGAALLGSFHEFPVRAGTPVDAVNFTESVFRSDAMLASATGLAWAPDGSNRLFVIRKDGQVQIIKNGVLLGTAFATVTPIFTNSECGLIGLCFDPDFVNNHYVYFFVTVSSFEQQIIRYTDVSDVGMSKTVIKGGLATAGQNHDGGSIGFGWDGKLYFAIGDNGNGTGVNADLSSSAAKVSRMNRDGTAPNDNPFFDGAGPNNDYIWARGVRNPFTMTFNSGNGQLWLDVVGTSYEQVFVINKGDHAGYNTYENNQPAGYITPRIVYRTNGSDQRTIPSSGAVRNNNIVTFTTTAAHGFRRGGKITIASVTSASFNGTFYVNSVPSTTTFSVVQTGPNETSGGGTATTDNIGGCVTGGCFYDSTAFPATHRGNFFFGDYNSGRVMRATLDGSYNVTSVDGFVSGMAQCVDICVGPDGALYYVGVSGNTVYRLAYNGAAQNLIVSQTGLSMFEGGNAAFTVRLAAQPAANVVVSVARTAGDADVTITSGASLTFTPANFATPQTVMLAAAEDADTSNDSSVLTVSASGLPSYNVGVNVVDNDNGLILSTTLLTINENGSGNFTIRLSDPPTANVTVNAARTSGDTDINVTAGATLTFTPANYNVPQTVTVAAASDPDTANDAAVISVTSAGLAPRTVSVTALDNNNSAPVITSTPVTSGTAGARYSYDVNATGNPVPTYSLTVMPSGMTINASTGLISWTPPGPGSFGVTVVAANGVTPNATQSYTISVAADAPPTARLTRPVEGEVVSGTNAEFFGDGFDDVGTTKAEFYVDNQLSYTDVNSSGHYHYGGAHNLWNTTALADGPHTAKIVVYDTAGQTGFIQVNVTINNGGTPLSPGLKGEYFDNSNFTGTRIVRYDPTVNFAWGTGAPIAGIAADTFSVRWTGSILAPATGTFSFYTTTDDGVRLWVNGQSLINRWIDQGPTEWSGSIALEGGKSYNLQLDYYDNVGNAAASLSWSGPGIAAKGIIPQASLSPVPEWDSGDIGTVGIPGSATINDSTGLYTVNGSGADIWGNGDDFFFVDQPLVGNGQIIARVVSVENTDAWAKAGVMIRESLASGARNAAMIVSPGNGLAFQRRVKVGATKRTSGGNFSAPYWVSVVRSGNNFAGYRSQDGVTWTLVGSVSITMPSTAYIGLAVTSRDNSTLNTSTFDNVSVTALP